MKKLILICMLLILPLSAQATSVKVTSELPKSEQVILSVWANEAIVATYTYDANNILMRQKQIATYFTTDGWLNYSKALFASKLLDTVKKNNYKVTSVAQSAPVVTKKNSHYQATMPLLIEYTNPQYHQKQKLQITILFKRVAKKGVRGLAIDSLITKPLESIYECKPVVDHK